MSGVQAYSVETKPGAANETTTIDAGLACVVHDDEGQPRNAMLSRSGGPLSVTVENTGVTNIAQAQLMGSNRIESATNPITGWEIVSAYADVPVAAAGVNGKKSLSTAAAAFQYYGVLVKPKVGGSQTTCRAKFYAPGT